VRRAAFAVAALLIVWSLVAWWGAAFSAVDHFKFGAMGAARIVDPAPQERCSWYFGGEFQQHCRAASGQQRRLALLRLGAPALFVALLLSVAGVLHPRWLFAAIALITTALAVVAIAGNARAALAFANGRDFSVRGSGAAAALIACIAMAAVSAPRRSPAAPS
jgi:hypothetical protein